MTARSRALRWGPIPKHPLQITMRTPKEPAFKFELLPLHSPLLGQSRLVSFPPLIDMLKFSGYPYLIRGQKTVVIFDGSRARSRPREAQCAAREGARVAANGFGASPRAEAGQTPNTKQSLRV